MRFSYGASKKIVRQRRGVAQLGQDGVAKIGQIIWQCERSHLSSIKKYQEFEKTKKTEINKFMNIIT